MRRMAAILAVVPVVVVRTSAVARIVTFNGLSHLLRDPQDVMVQGKGRRFRPLAANRGRLSTGPDSGSCEK